MIIPNTSPTVITDRNGKVTTVHRKNSLPATTRSEIPRMPPAVNDAVDEDQKIKELANSLRERSQSWTASLQDSKIRGPYILLYRVNEAEENSDISTLMIFDEFITDPAHNADHIMEAAMLLGEMGEDPNSYITKQHADAVFLMQDALMRWEMKYDNYKGGDLERRSEGREAFLLYVLEDPSRVDIVIDALGRGMPDLNAVMDFEKESGAIHRGISRGRL